MGCKWNIPLLAQRREHLARRDETALDKNLADSPTAILTVLQGKAIGQLLLGKSGSPQQYLPDKVYGHCNAFPVLFLGGQAEALIPRLFFRGGRRFDLARFALRHSRQIGFIRQHMRGDKHKQVCLLKKVPLPLEKIAESRNIAEKGNLFIHGDRIVPDESANHDGSSTHDWQYVHSTAPPGMAS